MVARRPRTRPPTLRSEVPGLDSEDRFPAEPAGNIAGIRGVRGAHPLGKKIRSALAARTTTAMNEEDWRRGSESNPFAY
jgi:hypothetical protein